MPIEITLQSFCYPRLPENKYLNVRSKKLFHLPRSSTMTSLPWTEFLQFFFVWLAACDSNPESQLIESKEIGRLTSSLSADALLNLNKKPNLLTTIFVILIFWSNPNSLVQVAYSEPKMCYWWQLLVRSGCNKYSCHRR